MKFNIIKLAILAPMIFGSVNVFSADSTQHTSAASAHSAQALAQTSIAGVKIASGIIAVPFMSAGEIGQVSGEAGTTLWNAANRPIGEPLAITDEIITSTISPDQAIQMDGE